MVYTRISRKKKKLENGENRVESFNVSREISEKGKGGGVGESSDTSNEIGEKKINRKK